LLRPYPGFRHPSGFRHPGLRPKGPFGAPVPIGGMAHWAAPADRCLRRPLPRRAADCPEGAKPRRGSRPDRRYGPPGGTRRSLLAPTAVRCAADCPEGAKPRRGSRPDRRYGPPGRTRRSLPRRPPSVVPLTAPKGPSPEGAPVPIRGMAHWAAPAWSDRYRTSAELCGVCLLVVWADRHRYNSRSLRGNLSSRPA
jgi:hypothetical protein